MHIHYYHHHRHHDEVNAPTIWVSLQGYIHNPRRAYVSLIWSVNTGTSLNVAYEFTLASPIVPSMSFLFLSNLNGLLDGR